jgi:hypothetical protein
MTELSSEVPLNWELFVTTGVPTVSGNPPTGEKRWFWSPISSTLIYGQRDAVLVDTFLTADDNDVLADRCPNGISSKHGSRRAIDAGLTFAGEAGGGLDLRLGRRWLWRVAQLDYVADTVNNGSNNHQNIMRVNAGLVLRF